jgi:hypothetical protein
MVWLAATNRLALCVECTENNDTREFLGGRKRIDRRLISNKEYSRKKRRRETTGRPSVG